MEPPDYSFLKTGFTNIIEPNPGLTEDDQANILSIMQIYIEESFKIATGFVIYEGRKTITNQDIILALKAQAIDHSDVWDKPNTIEKVSNAYQKISTLHISNDLDSELSEDIEEVEDTGLFKLEEQAYKEILTVDTRWRDWNPTEFPYNILKSAIDKTENSISIEGRE